MMKDVTYRKFDMVMCWSIDRLDRSTSHLIEIMNELSRLKIDIFFSQQSIDTTQSSGHTLLSVMSAKINKKNNERVINSISYNFTKLLDNN